MISLKKCKILTPLQKLPMNVGNLDKLIVMKALKSFPKCNKLPNLVTLKRTTMIVEIYALKARSDLRKSHAFTH